MAGIIRVENVSYQYQLEEGTILALDNVSLDINEGEFVAIVGHNGSGKSTLAKLLNGLLVPAQGDVYVYEANTKDDSKLFTIRSSVGMVFQNPDNQMVASIIEDDIAFGPENLGIEREEIKRRIDWALSAVDMLEHKKGTPFKLSGGQKQRIAIAGILAMTPKVLVLDESTAMLDPQGRKSVMDVVKKLNKEMKMTVIHITHYMDEAVSSDRIVVMANGKILDNGKPIDVFRNSAALKEAGLELPIASQLSIQLANNGFDIPFCLKAEELVEELCQ